MWWSGDTYHLFCSRWPSKQDPQEERHAWKRSQVIRATSKSLFGPYEFQGVVLDPPEHPWATEGIHNPKITRSGNRFLLYHLGIPGFQTGFSFADSIEGPWESLPAPVVRANNPALLVRPDGSVYMVAKAKTRKPTSGRWDNIMQAYEADTISGPFTLLGGSENRLPYDLELEDPTVWWADNQYHVICTDWEGKITGVMKSVVYFTSRDGIRFELVSRIPVWSQTDPIPMADGTSRIVNRVERPQVYVNEKGEVEALLVAVGKEPHRHDFIAIRPVDQFVPGVPKP